MNKRGYEMQYLWLSYMFLAILILGAFVGLSVKIAEDQLFKQKYLAIESAFALDAVSASPNDISIKINFENSDYILNIKKPCLIQVYESSEKVYSRTPSSYKCFFNSNIEKEAKTPIVTIKKENNEVLIS